MNALSQQVANPDELAEEFNEDTEMPLMVAFAPNWPLRTVLFRIIGTALILSASGVWIMQDGMLDPELMLVKLGITVFCFFCGDSSLDWSSLRDSSRSWSFSSFPE